MICPTCQGTLETCGHLQPAGTLAEIAADHQALINGGFLPARGESPIQTVHKHLAAFAVNTCPGVLGATSDAFRDVGRLVPCPVCRKAWTPGGPCSRCRRLANVGQIVNVLAAFVPKNWTLFLDALDSVADLLTDHAITARNHRRELNESIRDAHDGARDSYAAGVETGREEGNERW